MSVTLTVMRWGGICIGGVLQELHGQARQQRVSENGVNHACTRFNLGTTVADEGDGLPLAHGLHVVLVLKKSIRRLMRSVGTLNDTHRSVLERTLKNPSTSLSTTNF